MGNNCTITQPQLRNLPSEGTGDVCRTYNQNESSYNQPLNSLTFSEATSTTGGYSNRGLYGFCAALIDNDVRRTYCNQLGGEWEFRDASNLCTYSTCQSGYFQSRGLCCGSCCGERGYGTTCTRKKFTGDSIQCCLNDFDGCGTTNIVSDPYKYDLAYSENALGEDITPESLGTISSPVDASTGWSCARTNCQRTCDPCRRSITSNANTKAYDYSRYDGANKDRITVTTCGALKHGNDFTSGVFGGYCRDALLVYCTGGDLLDPSDDSWMDRWMDRDGKPLRYGALNVLVRNIYDTPGSNEGCAAVQLYFNSLSDVGCIPAPLTGVPVSASGVAYAQNMMMLVGEKYKENGYIIGSLPGTVGYSPFQDFLYNNVCCKFPVLCSSFLSASCAGYTMDQLQGNIAVANWCGCYMPEDAYREYVDNYQISKECTPACNRTGVIPMTNGVNQPKYCTGTQCIIDDLAISLVNTTISGTININQMCGNCASGVGASCDCRISQNAINLNNTGTINLNINETCTSTMCTTTDPTTGLPANIPCDQLDNPDYFEEQRQAQEQARKDALRRRNIIVVCVMVAVIIVLVVLYVVVKPGLADLDKTTVGRVEEKDVDGDERSEMDNTNTKYRNTAGIQKRNG